VVGIVVLSRQGAALDAESKAYVEDSIVTIGARWDADELWHRGTAHFREVTGQNDLRAFFDAAKTALGGLVEYRGASGQATIAITNAGKLATAQYRAKAAFEKGDADILVAAVKNGAEWRIEGFHINSSALMRSLVGWRS